LISLARCREIELCKLGLIALAQWLRMTVRGVKGWLGLGSGWRLWSRLQLGQSTSEFSLIACVTCALLWVGWSMWGPVLTRLVADTLFPGSGFLLGG
jgi:hypothetical protein